VQRGQHGRGQQARAEVARQGRAHPQRAKHEAGAAVQRRDREPEQASEQPTAPPAGGCALRRAPLRRWRPRRRGVRRQRTQRGRRGRRVSGRRRLLCIARPGLGHSQLTQALHILSIQRRKHGYATDVRIGLSLDKPELNMQSVPHSTQGTQVSMQVSTLARGKLAPTARSGTRCAHQSRARARGQSCRRWPAGRRALGRPGSLLSQQSSPRLANWLPLRGAAPRRSSLRPSTTVLDTLGTAISPTHWTVIEQ